MTLLRRTAVLLSLAIIAWWAAAQLDLLQPQYHPVPVIERLLYGQIMPALAQRQVASPPVTPVPTPTPIPSPAELHLAEKEYMLELINAERAKAGVPPVTLGDNIAAQIHVEISLENCVASHWGVDGLKPYMRYSLAGGYQSNGENGSGLDYCIKAGDRYAPLSSIESEIRETMDGLMRSSGHRRNLLNPQHRKVSIGLAWDRYNFAAYQHFAGDYVDYSELPTLDNSILSFAGSTKNGITFNNRQDLGIQVYYDPPPHPLTRGQLALTYCYNSGIQVAALRPPLTTRSYYTEDSFVKSYQSCPDPYQIPAGAPAPSSPDEANDFWQAAYDARESLPEQRLTVPKITTLEWTANNTVFSAVADLSPVTAQHGPGVYTIVVWGNAAGEDIVISEYSIFYGIDPPTTYSSLAANAPLSTATPSPLPTVDPAAAAPPAIALLPGDLPTPLVPVTPTPVPTATPIPTPTPTPEPTPTPTITPVPTPQPPPAQRHLNEKEYMLELINTERAQAGVPPVVLGDNIAAQLHAESALANCYSGHWGMDGLKPYMRYTLAGGYQSNGENGSGLDYCIQARENYTPIRNIEQEIREVMDGWMNSPGHRRNLLDRQHRKVSIGLAWGRYNFAAYQHFEGDYVDYSELPTLDNGILSFTGNTKNGIAFRDRQDLGIQVYYDPPPHPLTRGQLARTYCYNSGIQVAALRPPLTGNWFYTDHQFSKSQSQCPDPYDVPADAPAPRSHDDAHRISRAARSVVLPNLQVTGPWITASSWTASGDNFSVQANLRPVTDQHGPGVYTITVWHQNIDGGIIISEYSIFYGIDPPTTYYPP